MRFRIGNVIMTADLKQEVDVRKFLNYPWGHYDFESYGGKCGYIKETAIAGCVEVFFTGKIISMGAASVSKSVNQLHRALELLVKSGLASSVDLHPEVQNMVGVAQFQRLNLNDLQLSLPGSKYNPKQFPGLVCKRTNHPTLLIFSNGKTIVVGAKKQEDIALALRYLQDHL